MNRKLTPEQEKIIHHPLGQHARVLAVAGSGKTTTMVQRVRHLVIDLNQDPRHIRVVMFNRMAREDFEGKIVSAIPDVSLRPKVYTFHALAHRLRLDAAKYGPTLNRVENWFGETEELARICMHRAIDSLLREEAIEYDMDPEEALDAVGLWKASLIPPERAGHRFNPDLPLVYRRFEELRCQKPAVTFDDFVPEAMRLFERNQAFRQRWTNKMDHIIVDEYQDINYGQQQLVRLLAGDRADVMVVGDDDQTIYEWRGARPHYILEGFKQDFAHKPVIDYQLSHSFRFGPLVAQTAHNVIRFNQRRQIKPLVAHNVQQQTDLTILTDETEQGTQIGRAMAQEIEQLVRREQVPPERIVVLGRIFAQLEGLQTVFIRQKIPYRVLGMGPFFERDENRTLIDYIRLAQALDRHAKTLRPWRSVKTDGDNEEPIQSRHRRAARSGQGPYAEAVRTVLAVANTPSRKLSRQLLRQAVEQGAARGFTLGRSLEDLLDSAESPLWAEPRETLQELLGFLHRLDERLDQEPGLKAGALLEWIVKHTGYQEHFARYYGEGEASIERMSSVDNFIQFATDVNLSVPEFTEYLRTLDPGLGLPDDKVITMTTVHRTKGLEYDYVFIPACVEGSMPVNMAETAGVFDKGGQVPDHPLSPPLESERRLFYVALTRVIKHIYIGTIGTPESGRPGQAGGLLGSRFLEEIQLEPTRPLVKAVQQTLGGPSDGAVLLNTVRQLAGYQGIINDMLTHYLADRPGPDLPARIKEILKQTAETRFQYEQEYPDLRQSARSARLEPEPAPVDWDDPWKGIGKTR